MGELLRTALLVTGMLPMLAHSAREFLLVKAISSAAGLTLGAMAMMSVRWTAFAPDTADRQV